MTKVIGVRFRTAGKIYWFDPLHFQVKRGDHVIVETARGVEYGTVVGAPREVEDGRVVPRDADLFCTTDYGDSEGIYLDVYLKWYEEDGKPVIKTFATGKTLGETGSDMDRMFLISSAITKAFHGEHGTYARFQRLEDGTKAEGAVLHLTLKEKRVLMDALLEQRTRQEEQMTGTEQLLRRMTGSITAYMDEVGTRPLRMSTADRAVLAVRDGELYAFSSLAVRVTKPEERDSLLVAAAGRPGPIGRRMAKLMLGAKSPYPEDVWLDACRRAVDTGDLQRVQMMLDRTMDKADSPSPSLPGEVLRAGHSAHCLVQRRAAVAAVDVDGLAVPLAQWVEHVVNQRHQILPYLFRGGIVYPPDACRLRAAQFLDSEILHILLFFIFFQLVPYRGYQLLCVLLGDAFHYARRNLRQFGEAALAPLVMLEYRLHLDEHQRHAQSHRDVGQRVPREQQPQSVGDEAEKQQPPVLARLLHRVAELVAVQPLAELAGGIDAVPQVDENRHYHQHPAQQRHRYVGVEVRHIDALLYSLEKIAHIITFFVLFFNMPFLLLIFVVWLVLDALAEWGLLDATTL